MDRIVFCDIDGTLLNSEGHITPLTLEAIRRLEEKGIPFVISSGRAPAGIYPLLETYGIRCPIVSYNGALVLDEKGQVLYHRGIGKEDARELIRFLEESGLDVVWSIHSLDQWIVKDKSDPRVIFQEELVNAQSSQGSVDSVADPQINKVLCICTPESVDAVEAALKARYPGYTVARSMGYLLDVMDGQVSKAEAIHRLCSVWNVPVANTIAFGDNFNDAAMLQAAGLGYIMGNAPEALKERFPLHAGDNDHDGIYFALKSLGLI